MTTTKQRLPAWFRNRPVSVGAIARMGPLTSGVGLSTVCREARCPNRAECFERGAAAFMILGDICTRNCAFCAVTHGRPAPPDPREPEETAKSVAALRLRHAVVTSVTRDDLPDGGASVFAAVIRAIRRSNPSTTIEVLIPDFDGSEAALERVIDAKPDVINHNLETAPGLYPDLRSGASYPRSLRLLRRVRRKSRKIVSKSGIMVGAGESREEIRGVVRDLVEVECEILTIGQYLRPPRGPVPVKRYVTPEEFAELEKMARAEGIKEVASGPLVRSSYQAGRMLVAVSRVSE